MIPTLRSNVLFWLLATWSDLIFSLVLWSRLSSFSCLLQVYIWQRIITSNSAGSCCKWFVFLVWCCLVVVHLNPIIGAHVIVTLFYSCGFFPLNLCPDQFYLSLRTLSTHLWNPHSIVILLPYSGSLEFQPCSSLHDSFSCFWPCHYLFQLPNCFSYYFL
jgi:hypothetical protein